MPWQRWFQRPKWRVYHDKYDSTQKNWGSSTNSAAKLGKLSRKIVIDRKGSVCSSLSAQSAAGWSKLWTYTKFSDFPVFPFKFSPFPPPLTKIGPADYPSRKGNPSSTPPPWKFELRINALAVLKAWSWKRAEFNKWFLQILGGPKRIGTT